jgi:hypothetical protein
VTALRFVNVFTGGLAAGGLLIVLVAYAHALRQIAPLDAARLHSLFHPPTHRWMQTSTIVAALTAIAIAALDDPGWNATTILVLGGILGAATQAVLSRFWVVPMSDEMIAWPETGAPPDPPGFLRLWTILHAGRVLGAIQAFTFYLLSLLVR